MRQIVYFMLMYVTKLQCWLESIHTKYNDVELPKDSIDLIDEYDCSRNE